MIVRKSEMDGSTWLVLGVERVGVMEEVSIVGSCLPITTR